MIKDDKELISSQVSSSAEVKRMSAMRENLLPVLLFSWLSILFLEN